MDIALVLTVAGWLAWGALIVRAIRDDRPTASRHHDPHDR